MSVETTVQYYKDLMLYQYQNQAKAQATIDLLVRQAICDLVAVGVSNSFDIDSCSGSQLDILGKYIGFSRRVLAKPSADYMCWVDYSSPVTCTGFTLYDGSVNQLSSFLRYNYLNESLMDLVDEDYRILLKLKILLNNSDNSLQSITAMLYAYFGDNLRCYDNQDMTISYVVKSVAKKIGTIAYQQGMLPKPQGVSLDGIFELEDLQKYMSFSLYDIPSSDSHAVGGYDYTTNQKENLLAPFNSGLAGGMAIMPMCGEWYDNDSACYPMWRLFRKDAGSGSVTCYVQIGQNIVTTPSVPKTLSVYVKPDRTIQWVWLELSSSDGSIAIRCYFNISSGVKGTTVLTGAPTETNAGIVDCGLNGYRIYVTANLGTSSLEKANLGVTSADNTPLYANGIYSSILFVAQQLTLGDTLKPYCHSSFINKGGSISGTSTSTNTSFGTNTIGVCADSVGSKLFLLQNDNSVMCYSAVNFDVGSSVLQATWNLPLTGGILAKKLVFHTNGLKVYVLCSDNKLRTYSLDVAFDLTALTLLTTYDFSAVSLTPVSFDLSSDGTTLYALQNNVIYEYLLSILWTVSELTLQTSLDASSYLPDASSIAVTPTGRYITITPEFGLGSGNFGAKTFFMSTVNRLSSAVYNSDIVPYTGKLLISYYATSKGYYAVWPATPLMRAYTSAIIKNTYVWNEQKYLVPTIHTGQQLYSTIPSATNPSVLGKPIFNYNGGGHPAFISSQTNLFAQRIDMSNVAFTKTNCTVSSSTETKPDLSTSATNMLLTSTSNTIMSVQQNYSTSDFSRVFIFVKNISATGTIVIRESHYFWTATFDLNTKQVTKGGECYYTSMSELPNGWFLLEAVGRTYYTSPSTKYIKVEVNVGAIGQQVLLWNWALTGYMYSPNFGDGMYDMVTGLQRFESPNTFDDSKLWLDYNDKIS